MEFSHVDNIDIAQLRLLKDRVQQLQMQNLKLEHLLKTNSPSKISAGGSFLPADQFDLLSGCWSQTDDKLSSQLGSEHLSQQINLHNANLHPTYDTFFTTGPPGHQGIQAGSNRDGTAFIQNNQNTLVQNNTNLIQPINLVNIGSLTEDTTDASSSGFLFMRDGRLYVPQNVVSRQDTAGLPGIECMLGQRGYESSTRSSDKHLSQQSRKSTKRRPRLLKPRPIAPAVNTITRPYILPKQSTSRSSHQSVRKQPRVKKKAKIVKPSIQEDVKLPSLELQPIYCPLEELENVVAPPVVHPTYFNCMVIRLRGPRRMEDIGALVKIRVEENVAVSERQRVPASGRITRLFEFYKR